MPRTDRCMLWGWTYKNNAAKNSPMAKSSAAPPKSSVIESLYYLHKLELHCKRHSVTRRTTWQL